MKRDTTDIGNRSIHAHYYILPEKSESNKKKTVKPDIFYIISDLAKFFCRSFQVFNHNKRYRPKVKNISKKLNKSGKIVYM